MLKTIEEFKIVLFGEDMQRNYTKNFKSTKFNLFED